MVGEGPAEAGVPAAPAGPPPGACGETRGEKALFRDPPESREGRRGFPGFDEPGAGGGRFMSS